MPRYNAKYKDKYYVFSSISDSFIAEFDSLEELQKYRLEKYGSFAEDNANNFDDLGANKIDFVEALVDCYRGSNVKKEELITYVQLLDKEDMLEFISKILDYKEESK